MKLKTQLILRTVALSALVFGVFGALLIQLAFHLQFSREKTALAERSAYLVQSMEAASVNYALQSISPTDELLADILAQLDGTASLYDADGALIAGSGPADQPSEGMHLTDRALYALRPVRLAGQSCRLLTVSDLSALYQTRQSLLAAYSLLYLLMTSVFAALMAIAAKALTRPIERLSHVSAQLTAGELSVRAQPDETHETALLARSFNQMADSLTGQIERQKRFIADLTHEMKTPLTAMIGHADLIRSGRMDENEIQLAAHRILKEGQRLNALSARLIDLILLNQDQADLKFVHVRPFVEETLEALRPAAAERDVELTGDCEPAVIRCDPPLFSSLLTNLIDNALKSGASHIRVEGLLSAEVFTLRVSDDGRGMSEDVLGKITEPFYRADKSRSREQGGAGLGLALCAQIARLHHALLSFDSTPGEGTCVTLSLLGKEAESNDEA